MAIPFSLWGQMPPGGAGNSHTAMQMGMGGGGMGNMGMGMGMGGMGMGMPSYQAYAIPSILPSVSPLVVNPSEAIRDYAEHVISGDRRQMCSEVQKKHLEDWAKSDEYRKSIMIVIKARLELPWPYNYKALDILSAMPVSDIADCLPLIQKLNESAASVEGAQHLKTLSKGLMEKGKKEKDRVEEEDAKKKMAAVAEMWGGLWSNQPNPNAQQVYHQQQGGYGGWPYPYAGPPGVAIPGMAMAAGPEWTGKAPEGWTPWVIDSVPLHGVPQGFLGFPRQ